MAFDLTIDTIIDQITFLNHELISGIKVCSPLIDSLHSCGNAHVSEVGTGGAGGALPPPPPPPPICSETLVVTESAVIVITLS